MFKFGVFLVRIFLYSDWIRRVTEYLFVFSPNTGKYGPEKFQLLTNFTQCYGLAKCFTIAVTCHKIKGFWYILRQKLLLSSRRTLKLRSGSQVPSLSLRNESSARTVKIYKTWFAYFDANLVTFPAIEIFKLKHLFTCWNSDLSFSIFSFYWPRLFLQKYHRYIMQITKQTTSLQNF